jgi:hypothetical protein
MNVVIQTLDDIVGKDTVEWAKDAQLVGMSYAMWLSMYMVVRHVLFPKFSADSSNRIVSLVHSCVATVTPLLAIDLTALRADVGTPTTEAQLWALRLTLGYFLYDMFCCLAIELTHDGVDVATTFHHVATTAGLLVGVFQRISGHELLLCLVLMEVSNPCMHMRYIYREIQWQDKPIAQVNDVAFALTFLICRNILGAPVVYWTVLCPTSPWPVKLGGIGIALVSWFWTHRLVSMVIRKLKGGKSAKKTK